MTPPIEAAPARSLSLLRNRDYLLLWGGQIVSLLGTGITQLAAPLVIYALTRSPLQMALAGVCFSLPYLLFSLPAGALLDRWNRRTVLILCGCGCTVSMASIPIAAALGRLGVLQIYIATAVEGTLYTFFNLAETACLPRVVPAAQLPTASARREGAFISADLVSPYLGGVLLQAAGRIAPFIAAAAAYAGAALAFQSIETPLQEERAAAPARLRAQVLEGLRWLWARPLLRFMAFLDAGRYFVDFASVPILIVLAHRLHASTAGTGLVFSLGGAGGIVGAALAPRVQRRCGFGAVVIAMMWLNAALWPLFAVAPSAVLLGVVCAGVALCAPIHDTVLVSYRLELIPDALQGRVNSVFRCLAFSLQALGAALAGVLLQAIGATAAVLVFAGVLAALAVLTTLNAHVRAAAHLNGTGQERRDGVPGYEQT